ncbi:MAG: hypothetical protein KAT65_02230 [Methanophagales archaeon]|nr:hypothetical protein [Methanophagales archaeon]
MIEVQNKLIWKILAILILLVMIVSCATLSIAVDNNLTNTIYVPDDYAKIQWAVDNATAGDTITVRDGTHIENIKVKRRLTIRSENGPDTTIVRAAKNDDHIFEVTANYVNLSGFTVEGATSGSAGISLHDTDYCNISDNNCSNNDEDGIYLEDSYNNVIYPNNFINKNDNVDSYNSHNTWNSTSKITYIYDGSTYTNYLGNYWDDYTGTDSDGDGIGDTPYSVNSDKDNYPLIEPQEIYVFNLTYPS